MKKAIIGLCLLFFAASLSSKPRATPKIVEKQIGGHWQAAVLADGSLLHIGLTASIPLGADSPPTVLIPCRGFDLKPSLQTYRWIVRGGQQLTWSIRFDNDPAEFRSAKTDAHQSAVTEVPLLAGDLNRILQAKKVEFAVRFYPNTRMIAYSFFPQGLDLHAAESSCPAFRAASNLKADN